MKLKHYTLIALTVLCAFCKKKSADDPAPDPAPQQQATYQSNLSTNLILTRNAGNFDTSFTFEGKYVKTIGSSQNWYSFPSTNYNGYTADANNNFNGQVSASSNFMNLTTNSAWNVTSSEFGNFQYMNSIPLASISTSSTVIPATFDVNQGIPIKISGFQQPVVNSPQGPAGITLFDKSQLYMIDPIRIYNYTSFPPIISGTVIDTLRDWQLQGVPLNATFTLSINCNVRFDTLINSNRSYIFKRTTYNYPIKRIN